MKLSWKVCVGVFLANLSCLGIMFVCPAPKNLPARGSLIPGTQQKFLYPQDFWTMTWGDIFGVSLIVIAFAHLVANGKVGTNQWIAMAIIAFVSATGFLLMCLGKNHKPDWGFPEAGKVSFGGWLHLPYFGAAWGMVAICLWHLFVTGGLRGPVMWVGLAGGALYLVTAGLDIKSGNFAPLKLTSPPVNNTQ